MRKLKMTTEHVIEGEVVVCKGQIAPNLGIFGEKEIIGCEDTTLYVVDMLSGDVQSVINIAADMGQGVGFISDFDIKGVG